MSGKYRKFDEDFRQGAVQLGMETDREADRAGGRDLGMNEGTLGHGCAQVRAERDGSTAVLSEDERAELVRLRRENIELRMQRDVLKRATALWVTEAMGR